MKKVLKKGFTLVELLVVIAILAILATVSIVGYTKFIEKANLSNDQSMIGMINRNLEAEFVAAKPESAGEAISALAGLGFYGDKYDAYSKGYHYAYHLENNKFYLVDDENKVIFPEEVTLSELWGVYRDKNEDYIEGVTKYVATTTLRNEQDFNTKFTGSSYVIDLNNNVMLINASNKAAVKLINGTTTVEGFASGSDAQKMDQYTNFTSGNVIKNETSDTVELDRMVIAAPEGQKYVSVADKKVIIKNCVITTRFVCGNQGFEFESIIIEDCTFVGVSEGNFAVTLQYVDNATIVVRNNEFIDCERGVLLTATNNPGNADITIEGNTFDLMVTKDKNVGVQIAAVKDSVIQIKNNTMNSGDAFIRIYPTGVVGNLEAADLTFEGNTIADKLEKVFTESADANHTALINEIKAKIK